MTIEVEKRFWRNVKKTNSCWIWIGSRVGDSGYGTMSINNKDQRAHRISYVIHKGHICHGYCILHKCDNPSCVNPDHLYSGTHKDNMRDMKLRRRGIGKHDNALKGEQNPNSKLSSKQVEEIRDSYRPRKITRKALAEKYNVSKVTIDRVLSFGVWKDVGGKKLCKVYKDKFKKECSECHNIFPRNMFYKKSSSSDGITARCKTCTLICNKHSITKSNLHIGL